MTPETGLYIITRDGNAAIKLGMSRNVAQRRSQLQNACPEKLTLIFFGVFGERSAEIEGVAKTILRPWRMRGEWFKCSPFLAGIAIEAARDNCSRCRAFIDQEMKRQGQRDPYRDIALDEQMERDFADLHERMWPKAKVPPRYTRLIVSGFPEVPHGCARKPPRVVLMDQISAERQARYEARKARHQKLAALAAQRNAGAARGD